MNCQIFLHRSTIKLLNSDNCIHIHCYSNMLVVSVEVNWVNILSELSNSSTPEDISASTFGELTSDSIPFKYVGGVGRGKSNL